MVSQILQMSFLIGVVLVRNKETDYWNCYHFQVEWASEHVHKRRVLFPENLCRQLTEKVWLDSKNVPIVFTQLDQVSESVLVRFYGLSSGVGFRLPDALYILGNSAQFVLNKDNGLEVQSYWLLLAAIRAGPGSCSLSQVCVNWCLFGFLVVKFALPLFHWIFEFFEKVIIWFKHLVASIGGWSGLVWPYRVDFENWLVLGTYWWPENLALEHVLADVSFKGVAWHDGAAVGDNWLLEVFGLVFEKSDVGRGRDSVLLTGIKFRFLFFISCQVIQVDHYVFRLPPLPPRALIFASLFGSQVKLRQQLFMLWWPNNWRVCLRFKEARGVRRPLPTWFLSFSVFVNDVTVIVVDLNLNYVFFLYFFLPSLSGSNGEDKTFTLWVGHRASGLMWRSSPQGESTMSLFVKFARLEASDLF